MSMPAGSPIGLHRVVEPSGVLPQAARRLDPDPRIRPDEVRIRVERLNLDAASYRQLREAHDGDGAAVRAAVRTIIADRGKMQNPVTGSGGMLIGTVDAVGPDSPLGLETGDRVATLVSLSLTPLAVTDELADWDGASEQVPCDGHAILFGRSIAAVLPDDLDAAEALAVFDVCGAPALTARVVDRFRALNGRAPTVAVLGAAGKSGTLSLAAARDRGAAAAYGIVRTGAEARALAERDLADAIAVADATHPVAVSAAVLDLVTGGGSATDEAGTAGNAPTGGSASPGPVAAEPGRPAVEHLAAAADPVAAVDPREPGGLPADSPLSDADRRATASGADITVVCVDVPGCEHGAILSTAAGGTVVFFSMATSFPAAALGAEGLAADVEMLIGNGYTPGHADYALELLRGHPGARSAFGGHASAD